MRHNLETKQMGKGVQKGGKARSELEPAAVRTFQNSGQFKLHKSGWEKKGKHGFELKGESRRENRKTKKNKKDRCEKNGIQTLALQSRIRKASRGRSRIMYKRVRKDENLLAKPIKSQRFDFQKRQRKLAWNPVGLEGER